MTGTPKVMSLKFVASGGVPVGYLMVEADNLKRAEQVARFWAAARLPVPFDCVEVHQGLMDAPDTPAEKRKVDGVRVWGLPF